MEKIQADFNGQSGKNVSLADLIVLGGAAGVEACAKAAGHGVKVPFTPGRTDAEESQIDIDSFQWLEPRADGFRNHYSSNTLGAKADSLLIDRSHMLQLNKSEMAVLVGGMRAMGANTANSQIGVFTSTPGSLSNDFFVNLLDMNIVWKPVEGNANLFEGCDRASGEVKWRGSRADLMFGSNSQLRQIAEYYASSDSKGTFVTDFIAAWVKVMNNDRFDLKA